MGLFLLSKHHIAVRNRESDWRIFFLVLFFFYVDAARSKEFIFPPQTVIRWLSPKLTGSLFRVFKIDFNITRSNLFYVCMLAGCELSSSF